MGEKTADQGKEPLSAVIEIIDIPVSRLFFKPYLYSGFCTYRPSLMLIWS